MDSGELNIYIEGPGPEMLKLKEDIQNDVDGLGEMVVYEHENDFNVGKDYFEFYGGWWKETAEHLETLKKNNPHWKIEADMFVFRYGPLSLHRFDDGVWHEFDEEDFDGVALEDMDPVCRELYEKFNIEEELEDLRWDDDEEDL